MADNQDPRHRINYLETDGDGFTTWTPGDWHKEFADAVQEGVSYAKYVQESEDEQCTTNIVDLELQVESDYEDGYYQEDEYWE